MQDTVKISLNPTTVRTVVAGLDGVAKVTLREPLSRDSDFIQDQTGHMWNVFSENTVLTPYSELTMINGTLVPNIPLFAKKLKCRSCGESLGVAYDYVDMPPKLCNVCKYINAIKKSKRS